MWSKTNNTTVGFLTFLTAVVCASCSPSTGYGVKVTNGTATVSMAEYEPAFRNPMKGWREFFNPGFDRVRDEYPYPYGSMTKEYMQWNMMENVASDGTDKVVAYSNHRWKGVEDINVKVIPRAYIVWVEPWHGGKPKDANNPDDLNGWHWPSDMAGQTSPYKNVSGEWTCYIEPQDAKTPITGGYFAPEFKERVERFVAKLGQAWDNDPRVAYVEMGIIGEWGEQHDPDLSTYWPPHDEPEHVYNRTWIDGIQKTLGDAFTKAFKNKKIMVRYAYEFEDYEFGIYWDSWSIDEEIERGYNLMLGLGDRWKTQPIGGEITWGWGSLKLKGFRSLEDCLADDATRQLAMEQIRNLHCNHLGGVTWADFNNPEFFANASLLQKALGYRYVLNEARYSIEPERNGVFELTATVTNTGSSPFYYDWPVEVALLDEVTHAKVWGRTIDDCSISQWMPGDKWSVERQAYTEKPEENTFKFTIPTYELPEGRYVVALAILDPAGMLPSVRFADTNYFEGGYTPLGRVGIGVSAGNPELNATEFFDLQSDKSLKYVINK